MGGGRTHEKEDARIGRNRDGGKNEAASSASSPTQQPYDERDNPLGFSAGGENSGMEEEDEVEGAGGDAQGGVKVGDAGTVGRKKSALTPTASGSSGGRREKKPFRSKKSAAEAQPLLGEQQQQQQEKLRLPRSLGDNVSATLRKAESGASATAAAVEAAAAAAGDWIRPQWSTLRKNAGAQRRVEPELTPTRKPLAGTDTESLLIDNGGGEGGKNPNSKKALSPKPSSAARQDDPGPLPEKLSSSPVPPSSSSPSPSLPSPRSSPAIAINRKGVEPRRTRERKRDALMSKLGWPLLRPSTEDALRKTTGGKEEPEGAEAASEAEVHEEENEGVGTTESREGLLPGLPYSVSLPSSLVESVQSAWFRGRGGDEKENSEGGKNARGGRT